MTTTVTTNDIRTLFHNLDAPFFRYDQEKIEPIVWHAKDFPVQIRHEVKVPAVAGSTVKFIFSTTNGDINFSLQYITNTNLVEVIREPIREPSHIEQIKGSYKADYDGIFIFVFDNSYSWFTDKPLTYDIHLIQPAFAMADKNRSNQCRKLLASMSEESKKAKIELLTLKDRHTTVAQEVASLQARLQALTIELQNKTNIVTVAQKEIEETSKRIKYDEEKKMGLCIRSLDKKALSNVLSFVGKELDPGAYLTCKYWKAIIDENENNK